MSPRIASLAARERRVTQPARDRALRVVRGRSGGVARVQLVLVGATGKVGGALAAQIARQRDSLAGRHGLDVRVVGALNRSGGAWAPDGLEPGALPARLAAGRDTPWPALLERLRESAGGAQVVVDCTASDEVAARYAGLLDQHIAVVTPNKRANAGPFATWRRLQALARARRTPYLYETTVGAALPVIRTVRDLVRRGDPIDAFAGVLSGTLSFVLGRVSDGAPFSAAVEEARARGLTEPDPRDDLSGEDVARKLVILAREMGHPLEREEVEVESLEPADGEAGWWALDEAWAARSDEARARGERLVYAARWEGGRATVGVRALPAADPLAAARPGENVLVFWSGHYRAVPLTIAGPGAGPEVTAAGVLSDVIEAAQAMARPA